MNAPTFMTPPRIGSPPPDLAGFQKNGAPARGDGMRARLVVLGALLPRMAMRKL